MLRARMASSGENIGFVDPLSPLIEAWLVRATRASKGMRVYATNNEMLQRFLTDTFNALQKIFAQTDEFTLSVREDRFLHGVDIVHQNPDREESIPFRFFRNAFRRLTFSSGLDRDELVSFLGALSVDTESRGDSGEDLISVFWRLNLSHFKYLSIDVVATQAKNTNSQDERKYLEKVQSDIEHIVTAIYRDDADAAADDTVAAVSITKEDLEALKEVRLTDEDDLEVLDHATDRAIADIAPGAIRFFLSEVSQDDRDTLVQKMMTILLEILFRNRTSGQSNSTVALLVELFDSILVSQRYDYAVSLVKQLQAASDLTHDDMQRIHVARHLLRTLSTETRLQPVIHSLNSTASSPSIANIGALFRTIGAPVVPAIMTGLEGVELPAHRRMLIEVVLELGAPEAKTTLARLREAKWFVARDLLTLSSVYAVEDVREIVQYGLSHPHPKVREASLSLLRKFPAESEADEWLGARVLDQDSEVRTAAIRVGVARKSVRVAEKLARLFAYEDLSQRSERELRLICSGYASLAGKNAVPALSKALNPGFFRGLTSSDLQLSAATALASLGSEEARAVLQKGTRSISSRVREVCRRALSREPTREQSDSTDNETGMDLTPPPSLVTVHSASQTKNRGFQAVPIQSRPPVEVPSADHTWRSSAVEVMPGSLRPSAVEVARPKPVVPPASDSKPQVATVRPSISGALSAEIAAYLGKTESLEKSAASVEEPPFLGDDKTDDLGGQAPFGAMFHRPVDRDAEDMSRVRLPGDAPILQSVSPERMSQASLTRSTRPPSERKPEDPRSGDYDELSVVSVEPLPYESQGGVTEDMSKVRLPSFPGKKESES
jgi:hypothetical protein